MTRFKDILVKAENVEKTYFLGKVPVPVLKGVDLEMRKGEWLSLLGQSGSGKTTLLNMIGALEKPDSGTITYEGRCYSTLKGGQRIRFRRQRVGFIFQAYHMFPEMTVLENVMLPGLLDRKNLKDRAIELLDRVGLSHRFKHRPNELSGGEQQRAAIARALINSPDLVLADEPTGNLDSKTGAGILEIFQQLHDPKSGRTILMVTHDEQIAKLADRIIHLKDGKLASLPPIPGK